MQRFFTTFALGIAVLTPFVAERIMADIAELPKTPRPADLTVAAQMPESTGVKPANLFEAASARNYKTLEGKSLIGYMASSYDRSIAPGFHRLKTNGYNEFIYVDQYNAGSYTPNAIWQNGKKLCMILEVANYFGVDEVKYVELDGLSGELLNEKTVPLKDPLTEFKNYLPKYIQAAYSPTKDRVYGYTLSVDGNGYSFFSAPADDPQKTEQVSKATYNEMCASMCYNEKEDAFYGINRGNDFVKIDYEGNQEYLFSINENTWYARAGLTYLPEDNKYLFFLISDDKAALCEIDPETQTLTYLAEYTGDTTAYSLGYFDNVNDPIPFLAPEINNFVIDHRNLKADIKFTIPTEKFDGTAASGTVNWIATVDGNVAAEGTAEVGKEATATVTGFEIGYHRFNLYYTQDDKKSGSSSRYTYVGYDQPTNPTNVDFADDTYILTWDPVTGKYGGFLDKDVFKYVIRINGEVVGETTETSFKVNIDENAPFAGYQASVQADNGGLLSKEVTSNTVRVGTPWTLDVFIAPDKKDGIAAIPYDKDGDKWSWEYSEDKGEFRTTILSNHENGGDDILYLPPMLFDDANATYEITYDVSRWRSTDDCLLGINMSEDTDPDTEQIPVVEPILIPYTDQEYKTYSQKFSVDKAGVYFLSFESITEPYRKGVRVKNISVKKIETAQEMPNAVQDMTVTAFEKGELKAKVAFTMPVTYVNGQTIPEGTEIKVVAESAGKSEITGTPGSKQEVVVETIQGYNDVKVTSFIGENEGQNLIARVYTGEDTPGLVTGMTGYVTEDNLQIVASWGAPESGENAGENGFYVNADNFEYVLMEFTDYGWEEKENLGKGVFNYTLKVDEGSALASARLGISVRNIAGRSSYTAFLSDMLGTPYEMPVKETFENAKMKYTPIKIVRPDDSYLDSDWGVVDPSRIDEEMAVEGGVACYGRSENGDANGMLMLPKVSTLGSTNAGIVFHMWDGFDCADIRILGEAFGIDTPIELKTVKYTSGGGWKDIEVPFPAELQNQKWVAFYIDAYFEDSRKYVLFSSYTVKDGVSGVETVADGKIAIYSTPGNITVADAEGENVTVYSIDGRLMANIGSASYVENISLASGIYVVNVAGESVKIVVK